MEDEMYKYFQEDDHYNGYKRDHTHLKTLIVDDSFAARMILKRLLGFIGYEVEEAQNGKEAIAKFTQMNPDVTLMDITMPEMEGVEALHNIRSSNAKAKIIMVTSLGDKHKVEECIKFGAMAYILKPLTGQKLPGILNVIKKIATAI